jgi:hypothetical protein
LLKAPWPYDSMTINQRMPTPWLACVVTTAFTHPTHDNRFRGGARDDDSI